MDLPEPIPPVSPTSSMTTDRSQSGHQEIAKIRFKSHGMNADSGFGRTDWAPAPKPERDSMNLFVLKTWLQTKLAKDERGANLVEYILLVALIALAVIAAVIFLRGQVSAKFNETGSKLSNNGN